MAKYGFKDWDSLLASVGHGGLKEGQVVNRLSEEYDKHKKSEITDKQVLDGIAQNENKDKAKAKNAKGGISEREYMMWQCVFQDAVIRFRVMKL